MTSPISPVHPLGRKAPPEKLDESKDFGVIAHGDLLGNEPSSMPAFFQVVDGVGCYFRPDKTFHSTDGQPRKVTKPAPVSPANIDTLPAVTEKDAPQLLTDPRAEELLALPRDQLMKLVTAANGPIIAGEGSTQMMVAWLIKNTSSGSPSSNEL